MSLSQIMKYKLARQKFDEAKKWMENNYDGLSEEKKKEAFDRFDKVSNTIDEAWNGLTPEEREREVKKRRERVQVLAASESQNEPVATRSMGRGFRSDDNDAKPSWLQKHERCAERVQG